MKEQIKMAAKLYECHESAKLLFKDKYPGKISWYKQVIITWNKKHGTDTLKSVIDICQSSDTVKNDGVAIMMFMAAAVELIEPS